MNKNKRISDVVVIGAGIIGGAVAHAVSGRGMTVSLLDSGPLGGGASSSSFGWINATSKNSDKEYFELNAAGLNMYRALAAEWGADEIGLHQSGMIEWAAPGDAAKLAQISKQVSTLSAWGYPITAVDHEILRELEPGFEFEPGCEGYHAPSDCWLDIPVFLNFLRGRNMDTGVRIDEFNRAQELIADDNGKVLGVDTEQGRINCGHVVLTTGPDTPEALGQLTGSEAFISRFPLHRAPGLMVTTPSDTHTLTHGVVYTPDSAGLHIRDAGDGRLLLGADDTDGRISNDSSPDGVREATLTLLNRVQSYIPRFPGPAVLGDCKPAIGIRAVPADGRSIIGPALSAEGLYIAVSHSGITLAPVLGELIADTLESGELPETVRTFSLDRFD